jgi:nucleoid DNA-binding protein
MDKPIAMPLKEYLLRIMSVRTNIPEKTIEAVMTHQFEGVVKAMETPQIHSIEVSGFGKFIFNHKKALKKWGDFVVRKGELENTLKEDLTEQKRKATEAKLKIVSLWLEKSKPKIDGIKAYFRRLEEQADTSGGSEDIDRGDLREETEDMSGMPTVLS